MIVHASAYNTRFPNNTSDINNFIQYSYNGTIVKKEITRKGYGQGFEQTGPYTHINFDQKLTLRPSSNCTNSCTTTLIAKVYKKGDDNQAADQGLVTIATIPIKFKPEESNIRIINGEIAASQTNTNPQIPNASLLDITPEGTDLNSLSNIGSIPINTNSIAATNTTSNVIQDISRAETQTTEEGSQTNRREEAISLSTDTPSPAETTTPVNTPPVTPKEKPSKYIDLFAPMTSNPDELHCRFSSQNPAASALTIKEGNFKYMVLSELGEGEKYAELQYQCNTRSGQVVQRIKMETDTKTMINNYIGTMFYFFLRLIASISVGLIMYAGFKYIVADGEADTADAKGLLKNIAGGLILLFLSGSILAFINPTFFTF
ncbi:hypothetical protein COB57_00530 [Candidatus Peregrinibacteria bacterium]|nr:MAG: hypothetical protein COB57_00530 [Candidatus Peregrinibacteria bacterium]